MSKLNSDGFFKLGQFFQGFDLLNPLPVAVGLLFLQRMTRQIHPYVVQMLLGEQTAGEDFVRLLNAGIEIHGAHEGLVAVGHGVFQIRIVAQVGPVSVQHKVLQPQRLGQDGEMLILDDGGSISGESAFLQVGEHKEEMDAGEKFDDGVAQILESFVMHDVGEFLLFLPHLGHDVDEGIDAAFPRIDEMNAAIAVIRLTNAAVGQGVTSVIRIGTVVHAV